MSPKYPDITVRLVGEDGNAFAILGRVIAAMKRAGLSAEEIEMFRVEATAGSYDELLQCVLRWISGE